VTDDYVTVALNISGCTATLIVTGKEAKRLMGLFAMGQLPPMLTLENTNCRADTIPFVIASKYVCSLHVVPLQQPLYAPPTQQKWSSN
jgi:hypothetical protein